MVCVVELEEILQMVIEAVRDRWENFVREKWDELSEIEYRAKWQRDRRMAVITVVKEKVRKEEIRVIIDVSMRLEERGEKRVGLKEGLDGRWRRAERERRQRRKQMRQRLRGGRQVVVREDGQTWLLPPEVLSEIRHEWEQKRRKIMERWEAPPPGPPALEMGA